MPRVKIDLSGDDAVRRMLEGMRREVAEELIADALEAGAVPVVEEAKRLAPFQTGALRDSLAYSLEDRSDRLSEGHVGPEGDDVFYGMFVEFGTRSSPARPFLRPAADAKQTESQERMADVILDGIEAAIRRAGG